MTRHDKKKKFELPIRASTEVVRGSKAGSWTTPVAVDTESGSETHEEFATERPLADTAFLQAASKRGASPAQAAIRSHGERKGVCQDWSLNTAQQASTDKGLANMSAVTQKCASPSFLLPPLGSQD